MYKLMSFSSPYVILAHYGELEWVSNRNISKEYPFSDLAKLGRAIRRRSRSSES